MNPSASTPASSKPRHLGSLTRREAALAAGGAVLLLAAFILPSSWSELHQVSSHFADGRAWASLPNALDVLSNLPFLILGVRGLQQLHRLERAHEIRPNGRPAGFALHEELPANALDCAWLFFGGLILTAAASAFYHLQPDDTLRLAGDRAAMAVAFAGLLGLAVCNRVSVRAGWPTAWMVLATGLLSVAISQDSGNLMPWAVIQFGGMAMTLAMAFLSALPCRHAPGLRLRLGWVIALYALAKACEMADAAVYEATRHLISGHSLKHVLAAFAALPVLWAVRELHQGRLGHNQIRSVVPA
ncbi:hypothetical protein QTH91_21020 [Variovorax dokdonensis]|uniref:Ceramidase n=1 Tax=Variovorax dokdonensis TaxID=344883 RepID=A0ABT7NGE0_9BURK|nr:hypothetical protein [Variovorax dokdonensis]MDM0046987.1 hypothetical protein [Variovorax dokdonensis]